MGGVPGAPGGSPGESWGGPGKFLGCPGGVLEGPLPIQTRSQRHPTTAPRRNRSKMGAGYRSGERDEAGGKGRGGKGETGGGKNSKNSKLRTTCVDVGECVTSFWSYGKTFSVGGRVHSESCLHALEHQHRVSGNKTRMSDVMEALVVSRDIACTSPEGLEFLEI